MASSYVREWLEKHGEPAQQEKTGKLEERFPGKPQLVVQNETPATAEDAGTYRACFPLNGHVQTGLDVRQKDGSGVVIRYGHIAAVRYTGPELFSLLCSGMAVTVEGKNLGLVIEALRLECAAYVQEWDGQAEVTDGEPLISKITVQEA
jgi:hypothetical protein